MDDLISRQAAIAAIKNCESGENFEYNEGLIAAMNAVVDMPSATIYRYNIDHLLFIASVLNEKNIPPEYVADMVKDVGRVIEYAIDSFNAHIEKTLKEQMSLPEPPKERAEE